MTSIHSANPSAALPRDLTPSSKPPSMHQQGLNTGQTNEIKVPQNAAKVSNTAHNHALSQQLGDKLAENGNLRPQSQLQQLLLQMPVLQRLFTSVFTLTSSLPASPNSPLPVLLSQLLLPENQATLIRWLQQGAGKQVLAQLLQQMQDPQSPLRQWLSHASTSQQDEFHALLKLVAEQRVMGNPQQKEGETLILQWPLLLPDKQEARLAIERHVTRQRRHGKVKPSWRIKLSLPVGSLGKLETTALWDGDQLALAFESTNTQLLQRTEQLAPLLNNRLAQLGITTSSTQFRFAPEPVVSESLDYGIRVKV
ncbi:hypothetical protein [Photobacterium nomapromontoriensis]|uniref:hypothetical protein n=1 Tax=Photobacterium nomapromontoriensis TaxID=2910237 RepID=UPI003D1165F0